MAVVHFGAHVWEPSILSGTFQPVASFHAYMKDDAVLDVYVLNRPKSRLRKLQSIFLRSWKNWEPLTHDRMAETRKRRRGTLECPGSDSLQPQGQ